MNEGEKTTCCECGASITTNEIYGQSIDGESYICLDCMCKASVLETCRHKWPGNTYYSAEATFGTENVQARHSNKHEALKRAAEMAKTLWSKESYIERSWL